MKNFSRIYIEITNVCNLKCSFCIGNSRPPRFMNTEEFAKILTEIKPFTDYIYLHVLGEPLIHNKLEDFLNLAEQTGLKVNITTNGTLLSDKKEVLLKAKALRKISISLHSLEDAQSCHKYLENVVDFAVEAAQKGILCDLRLWNLEQQDVDNKTIFENLCKLLKMDSDTEQRAKSKITEAGNCTLAPNIFLGTAPRFSWPSLDAPLTNKAVFCHGLRTQGAILCDGTVTPCCLDSKGDIPLGNIFENSLGEILSSDRAKRLYDGFSARNPGEELCKRCGYATRF